MLGFPRTLSICLCLMATTGFVPLWGQLPPTANANDLPEVLRRQFLPKTHSPRLKPKKKGSLTPAEWKQRIDETWGVGAETAEKLRVFDSAWQILDEDFACFQDLQVDWQGLRDRYRPEIEAGVSRGRFVAIMNHLALALREAHTEINDQRVNFQTFLEPGVPIMFVGGWGRNDHFGAALTPLPDKSLLVYRAIDNHPLGLVPGDIVLGYDGKPWHEWVPELLAAQLPISGFWWGSSPSAYEHSWLMAAGMNWHLFDTIDIRKHATGEILNLSTQPLVNATGPVLGTEQLPIPGISLNTIAQIANDGPVSWGLVENTQIGYVYVWRWGGQAGVLFEQAIRELVLETETQGLIIDFRTNYGGNMFLSDDALAILFNKPVDTIGWVERRDSGDHLSFQEAISPSLYVIQGNPDNYYDKPIAVLLGPGALSSGDQVALRMKFHPRARLFGKSTTTAFNAPEPFELGQGWSFRYAVADAFLLSNPNKNLTHDELVVDEPVWLNPDDVAQGKDTVVEAAMAWIKKENEACTSTRWVNHVTAAGGGFTTKIHVSNSDFTEKRVVFAPYDADGNLLTEVAFTLAGNATLQQTSTEIFGAEPVSHFRICAPEAVVVTAEYRIATELGASAHVHESSAGKTSFRIYPGQWDYVFDGMALVNQGTAATQVQLSLLNASGAALARTTLSADLAPGAKLLTVFDSVLPEAQEGLITIETTQPAGVLFLRGTRPGVEPGYLFTNPPLPEVVQEPDP